MSSAPGLPCRGAPPLDIQVGGHTTSLKQGIAEALKKSSTLDVDNKGRRATLKRTELKNIRAVQ